MKEEGTTKKKEKERNAEEIKCLFEFVTIYLTLGY